MAWKDKRRKMKRVYPPHIITKAQEIISRFEQFTYGTRVLFLIHRNKEGGETNNTKHKKAVSPSKLQIEETICRLLEEREHYPELPLRLYMSVNARNMDKAIRQFKQYQLDNDYNDDVIRHSFYVDVWNRWISALMKPSSREHTFFLIDVDSNDELIQVDKELNEAHIGKLHSYPTKNGWHIITYPYNPAATPFTSTKLSKDGLLLLDF